MVVRRGNGSGSCSSCGTKTSRLFAVLALLLRCGAIGPLLVTATTSQASTGSDTNCTGSGECPDSTTSFLSCAEPSFLGDGDCDDENNVPECDYDGGDCCECTCTDGIYTCGFTGYVCVDPAGADCNTNTDGGGISSPSTTDYGSTSPFPDCMGTPQLVGDGDCDEDNNNKNCEWDGGDCCECTCIDSEQHTCGVDTPFNCLNPSAACEEANATVNASSSAATSVEIPTPASLSSTPSPTAIGSSVQDAGTSSPAPSTASPVGSTAGSTSTTENQSIPPGTTPTFTTTAMPVDGDEGVTHSPSVAAGSGFVGGSSNSAPGSSRGRVGDVGAAAVVLVMVASSWWAF